MLPADQLEIETLDLNGCVLSDGARVTWANEILCSCTTAKRQPRDENVCKHIVFVMKEGVDRITPGRVLKIIVALGSSPSEKPEFVTIGVEGTRLMGLWGTQGEYLSHVDEQEGISRMTARNIVVPYLVGMIPSGLIICKECKGVPSSLTDLMADRLNVLKQMNAIREVAHFLSIPTGQDLLCREHDMADTIPAF